MQLRSYNAEIVIATRMFMDVFNDIVIDRRDNQGTIQKQIKVPCVYGSRSRILKSLENRGNTLKLPLIAVTITGFSRDEARAHSVNIFKELNVDGHFDIRNMIANPININYTVSIITKFQSDTDQILGNFIPFFNPDIYVTWPNPYVDDNIKSQVYWDGAIDIQYPEEITETDPWRIISEGSFVFKTWMFPGMGDGSSRYPYDAPLIYHINLCKRPPNGNLVSGFVDDQFTVSGAIDVGALNAFYEVPHTMEFSEYIDNIEAGYILEPNFDCMPISGGVNGLWQSTSGLLDGQFLNPNNPDDLLILIENYDNPDLELITKAGYQSAGMKDVDWLPIWSEALSGRLSGCII
jgi:hypothetical protein